MLGIRTQAAWLKVQTDPLSYGGFLSGQSYKSTIINYDYAVVLTEIWISMYPLCSIYSNPSRLFVSYISIGGSEIRTHVLTI